MRPALAAVLLALWCSTCVAVAAAEEPRQRVPATTGVDFERCTIGDRVANLAAECATIAVPLDPAEPRGAMLDIAVARLPATGRAAKPDPVLMIAGGPGQSARDSYPSISSAFRHLNRDHDVLLIDQRGTGASGLLDCKSGTETMALELAGEALVEEARRAAADCLATLDNDPRLFTTSVAVEDLERIRRHLEIERWNLYGVSYGTRVAIHYARRFEEATRTLVLDAVVPPGTPLGPDIAPHAQRALDLILERCLADTGCNAAFPDIDVRTRAFVATLGKAPREVTWEDIASGSLETQPFSRRELAVTLRLLSYSAYGAALLPSMLDDAIEADHLAPFARQAALQAASLDETLATGMHYAVVCTEDVPFLDLEAARRRAEDTFLGTEPLDAIAAACEPWPAGRLDADFHAPFESAVPALILSGEADPVTPPENGSNAAALFKTVRHIVSAGQGHMQAPHGCVPALMAEFVATRDPAALSLDCLDRLAPPPFFIDANGPLP